MKNLKKMRNPKDTTLIFIGTNNPPIMFSQRKRSNWSSKSMFLKQFIGQGCTGKYDMVDIIPYNPDQ